MQRRARIIVKTEFIKRRNWKVNQIGREITLNSAAISGLRQKPEKAFCDPFTDNLFRERWHQKFISLSKIVRVHSKVTISVWHSESTDNDPLNMDYNCIELHLQHHLQHKSPHFRISTLVLLFIVIPTLAADDFPRIDPLGKHTHPTLHCRFLFLFIQTPWSASSAKASINVQCIGLWRKMAAELLHSIFIHFYGHPKQVSSSLETCQLSPRNGTAGKWRWVWHSGQGVELMNRKFILMVDDVWTLKKLWKIKKCLMNSIVCPSTQIKASH